MPTVLVTGPQNSLVSTHFAHPRRDDQAELAWETGDLSRVSQRNVYNTRLTTQHIVNSFTLIMLIRQHGSLIRPAFIRSISHNVLAAKSLHIGL